MAWMELHPTSDYRTRVVATTSLDGGKTWRTPQEVTTWREPINNNLVDNDAFLPLVGWEAQPHVCFYERTSTGSNFIKLRCVYSKNDGATWKSRTTYLGGSGDQRSYIPTDCHSKFAFVGDYNGWNKDGWMAVTALRYEGPTDCNVRPFIRVARFPASAGGCHVGEAPTGSAWPLALLALPLLLRRMRWTVTCVALLALLVLFANASMGQCVGDCDDDGTVQINEVITAVRVELGDEYLSACPAIDCQHISSVPIACLIIAVDNLLDGCESEGD
jgi:MYXO-CTERM domain-containing protein